MAPVRIATHRIPSSLRSKIQFGSENRSSVSTAFIAPAVVGAGAFGASSRSSALRESITLISGRVWLHFVRHRTV